MLGACARLGLDTTEILRYAGLTSATFEDPDSHIPLEQMARLWARAYELSGDPHLALHAVEVLPFGAYRVIDFLAGNAPTNGEALAKVCDYFPLINDVVRVVYGVGQDEVVLSLEAPTQPAVITRPYAEYTLAAIFVRTQRAVGQDFPLRRVDFSHARPADIA